MSRSKAALCGLLAGVVAAVAMTFVMLLLAWKLRIATPLVILGDRLSVFISPKPFFWIMGRVGGYNHLKQLGVASSAFGQIAVGALSGMLYGLSVSKTLRKTIWLSMTVFAVLPLAVSAALLWPVLGTHYAGLPIDAARLVTLLVLAVSFLTFERTFVLGFDYLTNVKHRPARQRLALPDEFSPSVGRRAFLFSLFGLALTGGGVAIGRKLFRIATFKYDGLQYKGPRVEPITPNDQFYCVTKNVIDPRVNEGLWHLEIAGLVRDPRTYRMHDLRAMPMTDQETTLMCISNGLDAGLMSNAVWRGIPMGDLLRPAGVLNGARVKLYGVDNYSDTIPLEKAMESTTLVAFKMNGKALPHRHGFPARAIVPGYFGEKHVKWLTRIEVTGAEAKGFYETQGWGPDFIVPIRSRIDLPDNEAWLRLADVKQTGVGLKGVAFAGDRGVSKVEVSFDDAGTWVDAQIDYPGTKLTWVLWSYLWRPDQAGDYTLVVRASDGDGKTQQFEESRQFTSGITGFHKVAMHIFT